MSMNTLANIESGVPLYMLNVDEAEEDIVASLGVTGIPAVSAWFHGRIIHGMEVRVLRCALVLRGVRIRWTRCAR